MVDIVLHTRSDTTASIRRVKLHALCVNKVTLEATLPNNNPVLGPLLVKVTPLSDGSYRAIKLLKRGNTTLDQDLDNWDLWEVNLTIRSPILSVGDLEGYNFK